VDDEARDRALEPAVAEGQLLRTSERQADVPRHALARDGEHLRRGLDRPDPAAFPVGERGRERPRAGADVEDAAAAQITERDERVVEVLPRIVDRAQLVVARRARAEVRARR